MKKSLIIASLLMLTCCTVEDYLTSPTTCVTYLNGTKINSETVSDCTECDKIRSILTSNHTVVCE